VEKSALIHAILMANPIVDFLRTRGYEPARSYGSRNKYICPIHGPEKDPSFYVFTEGEYDKFYCFGCKAKGDCIDLAAHLDNLSIKKAIGKLAFGLDIPQSEVFAKISEEIEESRSNTDFSFEDVVLRLSCACRSYLELCDYDEQEVQFVDGILRKTDKIVVAMDWDTLKTVYDSIVDEGLPFRREVFLKRKEKEEREKTCESIRRTARAS
jgi:hypothetical protein